jgi:hypothetical protein
MITNWKCTDIPGVYICNDNGHSLVGIYNPKTKQIETEMEIE